MYLELFPELDRWRGGHAVHAVFNYLLFIYLELFPELDRGRGGHAVHVAGSQATPTRHYSCLNNNNKKHLDQREMRGVRKLANDRYWSRTVVIDVRFSFYLAAILN
jgi:hypothetical protein